MVRMRARAKVRECAAPTHLSILGILHQRRRACNQTVAFANVRGEAKAHRGLHQGRHGIIAPVSQAA